MSHNVLENDLHHNSTIYLSISLSILFLYLSIYPSIRSSKCKNFLYFGGGAMLPSVQRLLNVKMEKG